MRNIFHKTLIKRLIIGMLFIVPVLGWLFNIVYEENIVLDEYLAFTLLCALPIYWLISTIAIFTNHFLIPKNK